MLLTLETTTPKRCSKCKELKSAHEFYKDKRSRDGLTSECRKCHYGYKPQGRFRHRLRHKDLVNKTALCSACGIVNIKPHGQYWRCENSWRSWKGSKSLAGYRSGTCPICRNHTDKLVYDHDHKTGAFRGWICSMCNQALGLFRDSVNALANAIEYLKMERS